MNLEHCLLACVLISIFLQHLCGVSRQCHGKNETVFSRENLHPVSFHPRWDFFKRLFLKSPNRKGKISTCRVRFFIRVSVQAVMKKKFLSSSLVIRICIVWTFVGFELLESLLLKVAPIFFYIFRK